jgi:hypothetical protein
MKRFCRNCTSFFIGSWEFAKEKLGPFFTEIQRRGEASRQGMDGFEDKDGFSANVCAILEQEIARMALVRKEELEVLTVRVSALEEKF